MEFILFLVLLKNPDDIPSGTVIFFENSNVAVQQFTDSPITHVAIIVDENGDKYVYEAVNPKVKKTLFRDYVKNIKGNAYIGLPKLKIDNDRLRDYLNDSLGKKYSISNFRSENVNKNTIFCSQLVVEAYNFSSEKIFTYGPQYYSPGDIWQVFNSSKISKLVELNKNEKRKN
jgi:hypothetical protein